MYLAVFLYLFIGLAVQPKVMATLVVLFFIAQIVFCGSIVIVARWFGIDPEEVGLCYGSTIVRLRIGRTDFVLNPLPLGAYVKFSGSNPSGDSEDRDRWFEARPLWHRVALNLAGPAGSIVAALLIVKIVVAYGVARTAIATFAAGTADPHSTLTPLWKSYLDHLGAGALPGCLGMIFLWNGLINLYPSPVTVGGQALLEIVRTFLGKKVATVITVVTVLPTVGLSIWFVGSNLIAVWYLEYHRS